MENLCEKLVKLEFDFHKHGTVLLAVSASRQVMSRRPERPAEWEKRVERLSEAFSEENVVELRGRGCRERKDRLLAKHQQDHAKALKSWVVWLNCFDICGQLSYSTDMYCDQSYPLEQNLPHVLLLPLHCCLF